MLILAEWSNDAERDAVGAYGARKPVVIAGSPAGVRRAMADERSTILIIGAEMWRALGDAAIAEWFEAQPHRRKVVYRYNKDSKSSFRIECPESLERGLRMSCSDHEPLGEWLEVFGEHWPTKPTWHLKRVILPRVPDEYKDTMLVLIHSCERVVSEHDVALRLGLSDSSLRARLSGLRSLFPRLPHFATIVGTFVGAHAVWGIVEHNLSADVVARHAGYEDVKRVLDVHLATSESGAVCTCGARRVRRSRLNDLGMV